MTDFFHGVILGKEVAVPMFIWPKILVQKQECVDLYIEVGGRSRWLAEYQWLGVG